MSREIKFRGKRQDNGEWAYGLLSYLNVIKVFIDHEIINDGNDISVYQTTEDYKVDSKTVGEFTGLKDKNGKEIYEGDICDGRYGRFTVFFEDGGFWPLCGEINAPNDMSLVEVVGNIYETPDLSKHKPHNP